MNIAVVGKNFGDEGKGLAVANICSRHPDSLIIKHNGGAQAGHTVELLLQKKKFIHHQIGSGAEFGARTLFTDTFHPDLFQLGKEVDEFRDLYGFVPKIYAEATAQITTIDDVIINMALESSRGEKRHGSCGMGINECYERLQKNYFLTIKEIVEESEDKIFEKLRYIRNDYTLPRLRKLGIDSDNEYYELLDDKDLLWNFTREIKKNSECVKLTEATSDWLKTFDRVIFETGQGLLLDYDKIEYMPYLTPSKTGIFNPVSFLAKRGLKLDEVIYVSRTYVTRHGAGPLPCETAREELPGVGVDMTNESNPWQGSIRYARHEDLEKFISEMEADSAAADIIRSVMITHLNETDASVYFAKEAVKIDTLAELLKGRIDYLYKSFSKDAQENIIKIDLN